MKYVYILRSKAVPNRIYVGCTTDVKRRLEEHNKGQSPFTSKYVPWEVISYFAFRNAASADKFELYLKTGSGRAFMRRHFL
jgi:putative endonuclease